MTEAEFATLLQRYLEGRCTSQEQALLDQWYDRLDEFKGVPPPSPSPAAVEAAIWQRLAPGIRPPGGPAPRLAVAGRRRRIRRWAAGLALLAAGLGVGGLLLPPGSLGPAPTPLATAKPTGWTRLRNATPQPQVLALPDGSHLTLAPGSYVRYAAAFAGPRREVYLRGEAFFQVSKNPARPFLVFSPQVVTTVLGTSFRVTAYPGSPQASVAVREGKVSVQASQHADLQATPAAPAAGGVLLLPNQQVVYSATGRRLRKMLVDKPVQLIPQSFEFEERPVPEVLAALEKAYGVDIVYDPAKLAGCTVSITYYHEPLFEKLDLLCKSLGASYALDGTRIVLRSPGCQVPPSG